MLVLGGQLCGLRAERLSATSPAESGFKEVRYWLRVPIAVVVATLAGVIIRGAIQRWQGESAIDEVWALCQIGLQRGLPNSENRILPTRGTFFRPPTKMTDELPIGSRCCKPLNENAFALSL